MGVVGVARDRNCNKFFSDLKPELEPYMQSMTVLRAIKDAIELVRKLPRVYATAEHEEGERVLQRLGFTKIGDTFLWLP